MELVINTLLISLKAGERWLLKSVTYPPRCFRQWELANLLLMDYLSIWPLGGGGGSFVCLFESLGVCIVTVLLEAGDISHRRHTPDATSVT
jgi:hypothetical protein